MVKLKRAYEPPSKDDGERILVERLWPRGLTKNRAKIDLWLKEIAPSPDLRKWYAHDPKKWSEFRRRYRRELANRKEEIRLLKQKSQKKVTFVYAARDEQRNSAVVLKAYLTRKK